MTKIIFVIDESGAKGYSDNKENFKGEIGVLAGFLILEDNIEIARKELDIIKRKYLIDDKVHITDLDSKSQYDLRAEIFLYLKHRNIHWVYSAVYVQGFYENARRRKQLDEKLNQIITPKSQNIRKELLHSELFESAFSDAIDLISRTYGFDFNLSIISDVIDKSTLEKFKKAANNFLYISKEYFINRCDRNKNRPYKVKISQKLISDSEYLADFKNIKFDISSEDSALTLAADVLVNSVYYHLKNDSNLGALNDSNSLIKHELKKLLFQSSPYIDNKSFTDVIYSYPSEE